LPLLVFCLSRSRMYLYVLPLFAPLTLLLGRALLRFRWRPGAIVMLAIWILLMLGAKYWAGARYPTDKDGRVFTQQLVPLLPGRPGELLFVEDMARNGLNL
jgi:hypothetical protein